MVAPRSERRNTWSAPQRYGNWSTGAPEHSAHYLVDNSGENNKGGVRLCGRRLMYGKGMFCRLSGLCKISRYDLLPYPCVAV